MVTGERVKERHEEERDAGRRRLAQERTEEFELEAAAAARAQERLALEQEAGQRTAGKSG